MLGQGGEIDRRDRFPREKMVRSEHGNRKKACPL